MIVVSNLGALQPGTPYWVAAVSAPMRDWPGSPGCRRGARFLIDPVELRAGHARFGAFDSRSECLRWIMQHRTEIERHAPAAPVTAVRLDQWILGLDAI